MENERIDDATTPEQEKTEETKSGYTPRPLWQVVGAWILLVVFIALMVSAYIRFFGGAG